MDFDGHARISERISMDLDDFGRIWADFSGFRQILDLKEFRRLCTNFDKCERISTDWIGFGLVWSDLDGSGRISMDLDGFQWIWLDFN